MNELIVPHPAVAVTVAYLGSRLEVPVAGKMPRTRPAAFVRVSRAGGVMSNLVTDAPLLVFECWATTGPAAEDLANLVRAHLKQAPSSFAAGAWIRWWREAGGPSEFPDPDVTDMERWQLSGTLGIATKK